MCPGTEGTFVELVVLCVIGTSSQFKTKHACFDDIVFDSRFVRCVWGRGRVLFFVGGGGLEHSSTLLSFSPCDDGTACVSSGVLMGVVACVWFSRGIGRGH